MSDPDMEQQWEADHPARLQPRDALMKRSVKQIAAGILAAKRVLDTNDKDLLASYLMCSCGSSLYDPASHGSLCPVYQYSRAVLQPVGRELRDR